MSKAQFYERSEVMSFGELLSEWSSMGKWLFNALVNGEDPQLPPYEWDTPVIGQDEGKLCLFEMKRGRLRFEGNEHIQRVFDEDGNLVASTDFEIDRETDEPFCDLLYFLKDDVKAAIASRMHGKTKRKKTKTSKNANGKSVVVDAAYASSMPKRTHLRLQEAYKYLGLSRSEFYRQIEKGNLRENAKVMDGNKTYWPVAALNEYFENIKNSKEENKAAE